MLRGPRGGGTGVHVKGPNGDTFILTNSHVCGIGKEQGYLEVDFGDGTKLARAIIKDSIYTDLCLVEPVPGIEGLSFGGTEGLGSTVFAIGHPLLEPLTLTKGELTGSSFVDVLDHFINSNDPKDICSLPKNRKMMVNMFFFMQEACLIHVEAYLSNVTILPGNSGSPLVNWRGQVIGLAFAGNSESHWGLFIPLKEIQIFLQQL